MKSFKKILICLALVVFFAGCSNAANNKKTAESESEGGKIKVYASVYPVYDFSKKIAGDKMDVELIMPSGIEPHDWEPDQNAIKNLEDADIFVYNGAGLESWTDKVLGSLDNKDLMTVEASHGVEVIESDHEEEHEHEMEAHEEDEHEEHEHDHGGLDPHVWLSPKNAKIELENIKNAFVKADPDNKDYYENNFKEYAKKFDELNEKYSKELSELKNNKIVVSHEAYGYLCKEYNLEQIGIRGVNAETEPDAKKMADIINFIKDNDVNTIFTEELIDPKVADIIANETGASVKVLSPIEGLSDEEVSNGDDYISIMEKNLENLVGALK